MSQMQPFPIKQKLKRFWYHYLELTCKSSSFSIPNLWQQMKSTGNWKEEMKSIVFPLVPLSNSFAIHTGLNRTPPVVAGPLHASENAQASKSDYFWKLSPKLFLLNICEALGNNRNPHNFPSKQTQVFAKLSLHFLLPKRWNLVCFLFVCLVKTLN